MVGVISLLSGDFQQTLPVIRRGIKADDINACIKSSYLWNDSQRLKLTVNVKVHFIGDTAAQDFVDILLQIRNETNEWNKSISVDIIGISVSSFQELKDVVYLDVH